MLLANSDESGTFTDEAASPQSFEAVYVLHCFQKKTSRTSQGDLDLAPRRYRDLIKEIKR